MQKVGRGKGLMSSDKSQKLQKKRKPTKGTRYKKTKTKKRVELVSSAQNQALRRN